jgi:sporulation protein YlmC with PRC-barrel domain
VVDEQQLESILGKDVLSHSGENMGRIVDIIVDHTGQPRAAIVDFGGFLGVGTRKIAINWCMLRFQDTGKMGNVVVDLARDQLRVAPIFKPGEPVVIIGRPDAKQ